MFRLNGACSAAVILGFLSGYPVGAKTAIALYEKGECTKTEAERLLSFCNNSGPAFILGAVGAGIFSNSTVGRLLYIAHAAASITVGIIFRFYKYREPIGRGRIHSSKSAKLSKAFTLSVRSSFDTILGVCAFVIFFSVAIRMLYVMGVLPMLGQFFGDMFGIGAESAERLLTGIIEVTSGLWTLQGISVDVAAKLAMAAFMLGWAGLSVHCQVLSFIGESGLSAWTYIAGKILHGIISAAYMYGLLKVFDFKMPVSNYLLEQVDDLSRLDFGSTLSATLRVTAVITLVLILCTAALLIRRARRFSVDSA
jgi:sporulation integral membrane protein YlbJ